MALIFPCPNSGSLRAGWTAVGLVLSILGAPPAGADSFMNDQTKADDLPIHTVYFGFGDDSVSPSERQRLDQAIESLSTDNVPLVVHGFTDSIGFQAYNDDLARRRSEAVRKALVAAADCSGLSDGARISGRCALMRCRLLCRKRLVRSVETKNAARGLPKIICPGGFFQRQRIKVGKAG